MSNLNCDGTNCTAATGEVRLLPYGGDGNMILCRSCFDHEMAYRRGEEKQWNNLDVRWENLKIYDPTGDSDEEV